MKIAVLGAGNVALATSVWLEKDGHDVHIWSALADERKAMAEAGCIRSEGILCRDAAVNVADEAAAAIEGAAFVIIAAPAFAHETLMQAAAPHMTDEQICIVHPVTGLSSLFLSRMLAERGARPAIVDLSTSLFTTRKSDATTVRLLRIKDVVDMAVIPAARGDEAMARLKELFGDRFRLEPTNLAISLNNHNPVYHVPPLLCNLSRADKKEDWIIWENITPSVAGLVKLADDERLAVVDHFGTSHVPVAQYFRQSFGVAGTDLTEIFQAVAEKLRGPIGPQRPDHRFFLEDVPCALVFYASLGRLAGIDMEVTESFITLTSRLFDRDFRAEGHTLERLGLGGMGREAILQVCRDGF